MIIMKKYWWLILLSSFFSIIFFLNFPFKTGLFGWDNLMNDFDLWLNFKRALFSSLWIDNQGLGHVGGHGHSALLFNVISLIIIKTLFPFLANYLIRSVFIFFMYIMGGFGAFYLFSLFVKNYRLSFLVALFYSLNLMTIQQFYLPLESFIIFHGLLPWVLWSLIKYWLKPQKKYFLIFFFIQLYFSQIGFLPPLFVVFFLLLSCLFVGLFLGNCLISKKVKWSIFFKKSFIIGLTILLVNSYWLIGVISYIVGGSSSDYLNSLNNKISTPTFIENSLSFGNLKNVILGESFFFHTYDLNLDNGQLYQVFFVWLQWFNNLSIIVLAYSLFFLIVIGWLFWFLIRPKKKQISFFIFGLGLFFVLSLIALGQNIIFFQFIVSFLKNIPLINQAFRATFTKFSVPFTLVESIFFGLGLMVMHRIWLKIKHFCLPYSVSSFAYLEKIYLLNFKLKNKKSIQEKNSEGEKEQKKTQRFDFQLRNSLVGKRKKSFKKLQLNIYFTTKFQNFIFKIFSQKTWFRYFTLLSNKFFFFVFFFGLIIYSWPIWQGQLFFKTLKTKLPDQYYHLFNFLAQRKDQSRIALLPLSSNWGWHFYNWQYTGSGFLWYGINQPILDRTFDSWSNYNESFYLELKDALYREDQKIFKSVLNKYQVGYLIVDGNLVSPGNDQSTLYLEVLLKLLDQSEFYQLKTFDKITVYRFFGDFNSQQLSAPKKISLVANKGKLWRFDPIYQNEGNYVYHPDGFYYPFLDLASGRNLVSNKLSFNQNLISWKEKVSLNNDYQVIFPDLIDGETYSFDIFIQKINDQDIKLSLKADLPWLEINQDKFISQAMVSVPVPNVGYDKQFFLNIGEEIFPLDWDKVENEQWSFLGKVQLIYGRKLRVRFFKEDLNKKFDLTPSSLKQELRSCLNDYNNQSLSQEIIGKRLKITTNNESGCLSFRIKNFQSEDLPVFLKLNLAYKDNGNINPQICLARENDVNRLCYNGLNFKPIVSSDGESKEISQYMLLVNEGIYWLDLAMWPKNNGDGEFILENLSYEFIYNATDVFVDESFWVNLKNYYNPKINAKNYSFNVFYPFDEHYDWLADNQSHFTSNDNCQPDRLGSAQLQFDGLKLNFQAYDGGASCYDQSFPYVDLKKGQLLAIKSAHQSGKGLEMNVKNFNSWQRVDLITNNGNNFYAFSTYPQSKFRGFDLGFYNYSSFGREASNDLLAVDFYSYPTDYISSLKLQPFFSTQQQFNLDLFNQKSFGSFYHSADYYYKENKSQLVVLNQSYHAWWQAYVVDKKQAWLFPFAGKRLSKTIFNNWANGFWVGHDDCLADECCLIVIFWPSAGQMFCWFTLSLVSLSLILGVKKKKKKGMNF